jgi:hypothetical protein
MWRGGCHRFMNLQFLLQIIVSYALYLSRQNKKGRREVAVERTRGRLGNGLKLQNVLSIYSSNILQNLTSCELC